MEQARVPSRESDNATWWHASPHGIHCQYWSTCWRDHTQLSDHGRCEVPNYRLFLKGSANKAALSAFVCESIAASAPPQQVGHELWGSDDAAYFFDTSRSRHQTCPPCH